MQALRDEQRYAQTPVIMCWTSEEPGDLTKARRFGVAAYVTKPLRLEQIEEPLRDIETLALNRVHGAPRLERQRGPRVPLSTSTTR